MMSEAFTTWRPLMPAELERLPESPGVYELATLVRTVLFIGAATDSLTAELMHHLNASSSSLMRHGRLYFRYRATDDPIQTQNALLADYTARHGGALPPAQAAPPPPPPPKRHLKAV